mmetsp:Transcript_67421/g.160831  ORF Transcript_67421/g.160831 Transcript_67421/m.160831 type:complete len:266 (-) Transcript_67421:2970-3767(-)
MRLLSPTAISLYRVPCAPESCASRCGGSLPFAFSTACPRNNASKRCMGSVQRKALGDEPSKGSLGPYGKFSSDLSGCNTTSTSSMRMAPWRKCDKALDSCRTCERVSVTLSFASLPLAWSLNISSSIRSISDLTDVGTVTTAAPDCLAFSSFFSRCGSKALLRSHSKVPTSFVSTDAKVDRSTRRDMSNSAEGTTSTTSCSPFASMRTSMGQTTVVFPWPMIICFTMALPPSLFSKVEIKSCTRLTWFSRSKRFRVNSKARNRGS